MEFSGYSEAGNELPYFGSREIVSLAKNYAWENSPFGIPSTWSNSLRNLVSLVLTNHLPMFLAWGKDLNVIYNDAYIPILCDRHPSSFMQPMHILLADVWKEADGEIAKVLAGEPYCFSNLNVECVENKVKQRRWFTLSYSPIRDDDGRIAGILCVAKETTQQVITQLQQSFRLQVAEQIRHLADADKISSTVCKLLGEKLNASRVLYVDVNECKGFFKAHHDWTDGIAVSLTGMTGHLSDFGEFVACDGSDSPCVIEDIATDPRTYDRVGEYSRVGVASLINVPVIKEGELIAALSVHNATPRQWTQYDVELAELTCDYTWPAVERSRAQAALRNRIRAEATRLRELFEAAPSPIVVFREPEMKIEMANEAYYKLVRRRGLVGKTLIEAVPELRGQGLEQLLSKVYETGRPYVGRGLKLSLHRESDLIPTESYHDVLYQPLFDSDQKVNGIFVLANDVTEAYRAQTALRESEERLQEGMAAAHMMVWDWDLASGSLKMSENTVDVVGGMWIIAEDMFQFVHLDDKRRIQQAQLEATVDNPRYLVEFRFIRPDTGKTIWLETSAHVFFDGDGKAYYIKGITIDITRRKESEQELLEANRQKDEFLAMLGHELRNPLAPIRTAAELIKLVKLNEEKLRHTSEIIIRQVDHMTELVDDLLDVSRVTRGLVELDNTNVDLKQVVSKSIEQVSPLIAARHHQLAVDLPKEPSRTLGDEKRLVQILANILNNAAKYTPEGGKIALHMENVDAMVEISISDNGIGIPEELLPHVFDLFRQGARTSDRAQGGLGLGLALVKSLMELHGGSIRVESRGAGLGSTFTLCFPLVSDDVGWAPHQKIESTIQGKNGKKFRIMVVDDNADAALTMAMFLKELRQEVIVVHEAQDALQQAQQQKIDVCLLDIGLPDINGYELVSKLRQLPGTTNAVMIAVTGYGQDEDKQKSTEAGFNAHLVKPIDMKTLLDALDRVTMLPHSSPQNP